MKNTCLATLALPFLAALPLAQGPASLIGLTRNTPTLRHLGTNCSFLSQCQLLGMPPAGNLPFVGGTAWDPRRPGAWVTNGQVLAKYSDDCSLQCGPMPIPSLSTVSTYITGLEVIDGSNQLWMIDNQGDLHFYSNTCPPVHLGGCNTVLTPTPTPVLQVTTGLAADEGLGLVFISYPDLLSGLTRIAVNDLSNPCQQVDMVFVPPCASTFGPVTGLACDWGRQILYATDGISIEAMHYAWNGSNLTILNHYCCPAITVAEPMIGLAVRPGRATTLGSPCANGSCPACAMVHTLINDPVIGNAQFKLRLDDAFGNSFSFCLIGDGPCHVPGVSTPIFCGPIYTVPFLGYLGANLISGPSICGGGTTFDLPLPLTPSLVNGVYSSQCVNLCVGPGGGLGFAMSNCLSWELQGI